MKGYEYEKGQYVLIEPEEIKKITPVSAQTMDILAFVDESQVDPIYFDSSFLAVPEAAGAKAYRLLIKALEDTNRMGVAKLTMHQREYTVFLRPRKHGLTLHTMFYSNEIANIAEYGKYDESKLNPQEVKLAEQLVETLAADFNPRQYRDEFQERLNALIEAKSKGKIHRCRAATPRRSRHRHHAGIEEKSRRHGREARGTAGGQPANRRGLGAQAAPQGRLIAPRSPWAFLYRGVCPRRTKWNLLLVLHNALN